MTCKKNTFKKCLLLMNSRHGAIEEAMAGARPESGWAIVYRRVTRFGSFSLPDNPFGDVEEL